MFKEKKTVDVRILNLVLFILLAGMYFYLAAQKNFWYDEAYTLGMIYNSYGEIVEITSKDVHSPLYYWMLKAFCELNMYNRLILSKVFSWVFMIAFLYLGRRITRKMYNSTVETYWLLCAGFMPAMVIQATTARMYTMALFFMTLALYLAYELYRESSKVKWFSFTLISVILVYTHTFCMLEMVLIYISLLIGAMKKRNKLLLGKTIISGGVVSICYLPWLNMLIHQFLRWSGVEKGWSNTIEEISVRSFWGYMSEWFSSLEQPWMPAIIFGVGLVLVTGLLTYRYAKRQRDYIAIWAVGIIVFTVLIALGISVFCVPCFLGRYVFPLFGGLWLMVAVGIAEIKYKKIRCLIVIIILGIGIQAYAQELKLENSSGLEQYLECISEYDDNQVIMADTYYGMMLSIYMPEAEYMVWGNMPECLPFPNCTAFTQWEQLQDTEVVWYISLKDFRVGRLDEYFHVTESIEISYSYYDLVIDKYVRNS